MKKTTIKKWLFATCALAFVSASAAIAVPAVAYADGTVTPVTVDQLTSFEMIGASVRLSTDTGIRFSANLSDSEWAGLKAEYGEENISFGTVIMPYDYDNDGITESELFGENAKYTWSYKTEEEGGGTTEVIHINSLLHWKDEDNAWRVNGSIAPVKEVNYARNFVGACYIAATNAEGEVEYKMATQMANAERSIVKVAQLAKELPDLSTQDRATLEGILDTYKNSTVASPVTTVNYTVNKYYDDKETVTTTATADFDTTVTLDTATLAERFYAIDEEKSTLSGLAYIDNSLVLNVYYESTVDVDDPSTWLADEYSTITYADGVYTLTHDNELGCWHDFYISKKAINHLIDTKAQVLLFTMALEGKYISLNAPVAARDSYGSISHTIKITEDLRDKDYFVLGGFVDIGTANSDSNTDNMPFTVTLHVVEAYNENDPTTWMYFERAVKQTYDVSNGKWTLDLVNGGNSRLNFTPDAVANLSDYWMYFNIGVTTSSSFNFNGTAGNGWGTGAKHYITAQNQYAFYYSGTDLVSFTAKRFNATVNQDVWVTIPDFTYTGSNFTATITSSGTRNIQFVAAVMSLFATKYTTLKMNVNINTSAYAIDGAMYNIYSNSKWHEFAITDIQTDHLIALYCNAFTATVSFQLA